MPCARPLVLPGLLLLVACTGPAGSLPSEPGPSSPGRDVRHAAEPIASPSPGILDTTLPFVSGPASNLFLAVPRTAELFMVPGAGTGIGNPVLGPGPEYLVFHDRDGHIVAWDPRSDLNILIEGEPGRDLSAPSVAERGDGLVYHGPEQLYFWQRISRPSSGTWPLRGRTRRFPAVSAWARAGGGLAEAWADAALRQVLLRNVRGEVALADLQDDSVRTLRTGDLGPIRSCSISPSGRRLLLESARGLHAYDPETRRLDSLPEVDLALGGPGATLGSWQAEDGFLAQIRNASGQSRYLLSLWPSGRVISAWSLNDFSGLR